MVFPFAFGAGETVAQPVLLGTTTGTPTGNVLRFQGLICDGVRITPVQPPGGKDPAKGFDVRAPMGCGLQAMVKALP
ncbi:MAG: hypothetical protein CMF18_11185 [Idiomarinaceae bacterium]|nr:hypothetical protein [Idiomarinaceae bacterium]